MPRDTLKSSLMIHLIMVLFMFEAHANAQTTRGETKKTSIKTPGRTAGTTKNGSKTATKKTSSTATKKIPLVDLTSSEPYNTDYIAGTLSKTDVNLLMEDFPDLASYAASKEKRKALLDYFKEMLVLAEEARANGIADDPKVKKELDLQTTKMLADAYTARFKNSSQNAITKAEVYTYFKRDGAEERFREAVKELQESGQLPGGGFEIKELIQFKEDWARLYIGAEKAIQLGLDKERKLQVHIEMSRASLLAGKLNDRFQPNEEEIARWLFAHPEYDTKPKRARAESLLKRARAGEDFVKLVNENTDDPGNKDSTGKSQGGYYEFGRGVMVKEFEEASFALQPGQISDIVETDFGFHIIKLEGKEVRKGKDGKDEETVKVRHLLISTMVDTGDPSSPAKIVLREKAKQEVEKQKHTKLVNELSQKYTITLPDDFDVKVAKQP